MVEWRTGIKYTVRKCYNGYYFTPVLVWHLSLYNKGKSLWNLIKCILCHPLNIFYRPSCFKNCEIFFSFWRTMIVYAYWRISDFIVHCSLGEQCCNFSHNKDNLKLSSLGIFLQLFRLSILINYHWLEINPTEVPLRLLNNLFFV